MTISPIRFSAYPTTFKGSSVPRPRFGEELDEFSPAPREEKPEEEKAEPGALLNGLMVLVGGLMFLASFIGGGVVATKAMVEYDGQFFNMPSVAERDYIRSKTMDPWLAAGFFGGPVLAGIGLTRGKKPEEQTGEPKPKNEN